jgi:gas vesicle protein
MNNSKLFFAFVAGAAIGAFAGVMMAPAKGSELRRDIADKAKDLLDTILARAEEIMEEAEEMSANSRASL